MTKSCKVSVVIPCFNHGEFLPEAVASVRDVKRGDIELIVVDDGSTEERTHREIDKLIEQGFNVLRQENKGLAAARNRGIRISQGEYILPLDADNRIRSRYIKRGIRILDANPEVGVVYGDAMYFGTRTGLWHVGAFDRVRLWRGNYIDACAIYRRSVWEQNGGYDGTMPVQGLEDWDFWLSTLEHGWQFAYIPEVLFDYRVSKESMNTRAAGFESETRKFIELKHDLFYQRAWLQLERERQSVKVTSRNLYKLIKSRLEQKFAYGDREY